ncbi:cysteinyl-tRNA synthetase [Candidatus Kinetoplastibacterium oncopeltii TCC290E]|uniref:Cysteine--tRNA ligase n=1 Tax=Candidatus Kinetoplastidibacterium stringomonadis TCC290E TaxID=1208920 RepID=M1M841_9PROT|nr:cysteine--tRNA ligase [Candidatus Kinetoplastibacterium oncopeltii]AGF48180.1 cysteinyl-tRNA synthetase [Candidatus Kinetoplastibacterium oncopeltii TCC290E]
MLQIYNTLTRSKSDFKPINDNVVNMYVCGMTVYDYCHLGHARIMVVFDVIQRWLKNIGFDVRYVRNITDIDDKIINKSLSEHKSIKEITEFYISAMHMDEKALNIETPFKEPKATDYVNEMVDIIKLLEGKGLAYKALDGDVNFSIKNFNDYGKLSGINLNELRSGNRVSVSSFKADPLDFVLWKSYKKNDPYDSRWDSCYGVGRPGWHIECSAMSHSILGNPIDIHGGGPDLIFPHHENEIAQTEGAFGTNLANFWMHCGPLMVDDAKMSKSLGNYYTIRQAIGKEILPVDFRYEVNLREAEMLRFFIIRSHYRSKQNYTFENLVDAQNSLDKLYLVLFNINVKSEDCRVDWSDKFSDAFKLAMNDDFNTPNAIAILFDLASKANKNKCIHSATQLKSLAGILGILSQDPMVYFSEPTRYKISVNRNDSADILSKEDIENLICKRSYFKRNNDYLEADKIRSMLNDSGIELEDTSNGNTNWRRV